MIQLLAAKAFLATLPWRLISYGLLVLGLILGYFWWRDAQRDYGAGVERAAWQVKIKKQEDEAARMLAEERAKVAEADGKLKVFREQQETRDAENRKTVDGLATRFGDLAVGGRLRDPNSTGCRSSGAGPTTQAGAAGGNRAGDSPVSAGLLSAELSGLLRDRTLKADRINNAYAACRAQAIRDREVMQFLDDK